MMQGDACFLSFDIRNNALSPVTPEDVREVELTVEGIRRTYTSGGLFYEQGVWFMPLTQRESFTLPARNLNGQVRICWTNGVVEGCAIHGIHMEESLSREVI